MKIVSVRFPTDVIVGDYQFADKVKDEVLSALKVSGFIPKDNTNVNAFHTEWNWQPDNITFRNLKSYIREQIETHWKPGSQSDGQRRWIRLNNFWANVYYKGDYAIPHCHRPNDFSFAYFVKAKWYDSPLVFPDTGVRIRPKEGRFVIFPSYLIHGVPKHRFKETRITLSGNYLINRDELGMSAEDL